MNIQQLLDSTPENFAYKIIQPHKRTIKIRNKMKMQMFDFHLPLLFIIQFSQNQLYEFHALECRKNKFYQVTRNYDAIRRVCTEICLPIEPINFYKLSFLNKEECLNQAINAFFNSDFHNMFFEYKNLEVRELSTPFAKILH